MRGLEHGKTLRAWRVDPLTTFASAGNEGEWQTRHPPFGPTMRNVSLFLALITFTACGTSDPDSDTDQRAGAACTVAEDCPNLACECRDMLAPVNTRNCTNGACVPAEEACPRSCGQFGTTWTGRVVQPVAPSSSSSARSSSSSSGGTTSSSARPSSSSTAGPLCGGFFSSNTCGTCGQRECCAEGAACQANTSCREIAPCISSCVYQGATQAYCASYCIDYFAAGATAWNAYEGCMDQECYSPCH